LRVTVRSRYRCTSEGDRRIAAPRAGEKEIAGDGETVGQIIEDLNKLWGARC
jgi:hypothetical protein